MSRRTALPAKLSALPIHDTFLFAHRANVERYKKLLGTDLTEHERAFIQLRLFEEQAALRRLAPPDWTTG